MMTAESIDRSPMLGELLGSVARAHRATPVSDLVLDSRDVRPGAAFVAVQGRREHGLAHAADALARGAAVVLYDPPVAAEPALPSAIASRCVAVPGLAGRLGELAQALYGPALGTPALCGVTGTNGKTTVAYLLAQAMTGRGDGCGYVGTLGYGVPPRIVPHALTTPDVFTLHRELVSLATPYAALEVSSHALAQDRIAGLAIETAAFTNLTRDHLDEHGDLESYGHAKSLLFTRTGLRHAVLNVDDAFGASLALRLPPTVEAITVGCGPGADVQAAVRSLGLAGLDLTIAGRYGTGRLASPLIGDFNAENLLVALGVLIAWRLPLAEACDLLSACVPPPGRLEVIGARAAAPETGPAAVERRDGPPGGPSVGPSVGPSAGPSAGPWVVVDYAHTPDGLARALDALADIAAGDVWCVFGCGGERDRGKRPLMGAAAAERAAHIVLTDDNPRGEDPAGIVADIVAGVANHPHVVVEHDRRRAIELVIRSAAPADVVLIAGKGHETTQSSGGATRPFDDRAVARAALGAAS